MGCFPFDLLPQDFPGHQEKSVPELMGGSDGTLGVLQEDLWVAWVEEGQAPTEPLIPYFHQLTLNQAHVKCSQ